MEKDILETFDAAKKAADKAAEAGDGSSEVDRCVDALRRLRRIPVTMQQLVETQVGKRLRSLKKHRNSKIQAEASVLLEFWKDVVIQETSNSKKNGGSESKSSIEVNIKSERTETVKIDRTSKAGPVNMDRISTSESPNFVKKDKNQDSKTEMHKTEKNENSESGGCAIKANRIPNGGHQASTTKKPSTVSAAPPKLTTMIKCNDPIRDKIRELLAEAFSKVSCETSEDERDEVRNILDEVNVCDPIRVAVMVESVMFEKLGRSNGAQKLKYRSIMFNLKDGNNTDLRRRVLLGEVKPEKLVVMTPEEMASDKRKLANEQIKEKALFECQREGAAKATTDQFKCGRCGQRKTTYYQLQTRSADEPMTTFVTCVNCNNHWKFC
ncbi:Transcription elongation factor A protein [Musa troglodytarum]|uniref:Transcription elongation factor n=2 Tax=Musa troglodytarum TaxID=320322 RepID=A0A9E7K7G9_9LILI|nr:Transcription elongation factor A protein [Musa troglodytarum]